MKKIFMFMMCMFAVISLSACNFNDPFEIYKSYGDSFHFREEVKFYDKYSGKYEGSQIAEIYGEGEISYSVGDGVVGPLKQYLDSKNLFSYEYDYNTGVWYREKWERASTGEFQGWWEKENYDYRDGVYTLKGYFDIGQIEYRKVHLNSEGLIVVEEKFILEDFTAIKITTYIDGGENYNLKLPEIYKIR